jgi:hypothetical protein
MPRFLPQIWQHRPPIFFLACQHAIACLIFVFALLNGSMQAQTSLEVSVAGPSTVRLGGNARYSASVGDKAVSVVWSVDGVAGGTNFTGRISAEGVYSPASTIPAGHSVRIGATTESTPASSGLLRVRVLNPLPTLTSGSVTQAASGMSYLLDVRGSDFVPGSQLLVAGSSSPTVFFSSTELQSTISLTPGTTTITAGILNPEAEQRSPVSMTLPVQAGATSGTLSTFSCSSTSMTGPGSDRCMLTLTAAAGSDGVPVKVTSSNASITVPATVTILPNATSAGFTATVPSVPSAEVVTLNASANGISKSFSLELNASSPALTVSVTSVPFGNVALNTSSTQPVILSSTGNAPVIIKSASVSGTGFTISGATFPVTLNPGLALTLEVQFNPIVEGTATGTLTIQSNSSTNGTAMVILNASGVAHHVDLSWEGPGSSAVPIVSYKIYRLANGGSAYQLLSSSTGSETAYVDNSVQSGATYDYIVTSLDSAGVESAPSNNVSVTIP